MILFLDIISPLPRFFLIEKNNVIHSIQILNKKNNKISDSIIPTFKKIEKKLKRDKKIKKLLVCTGPGSYTALRVGIGFMYGLSFARKIPLKGISCTELLQLSIPVSKIKKTAIIICSSNKQNFICTSSNRNYRFVIKKIDNNFKSMNFDYNKFPYCVSNCKSSIKISKNLHIKKNQVINFADIIRKNSKKLFSLTQKNLITPIYVSDNKILN